MSGIKRALISVSDKTGIAAFARGLAEFGVELISTGGTADLLQQEGVAVQTVSDLTHFPEMLDGRVKTLHPAVHGGILARREDAGHLAALTEHDIRTIDLVCVNLYPFESTISKPGVEMDEVIENIDIGGPAMVRSAAKNHSDVTVVVDPDDYKIILEEMRELRGATLIETRRLLAAKAFAHTGRYDAIISRYLAPRFDPDNQYPDELAFGYSKQQNCRYGENPHQSAAFYVESGSQEPSIANAKQIHGKELSFNNIYDINAALEIVKEFTFSGEDSPAAVVVKHTNPCGAALAGTLEEAFRRARDGDSISAFGGILAVNRVLDAATAEEITGKNTFFEAIIAPGFDSKAISILTERKKWGANLRLLQVGDLSNSLVLATGWDTKKVVGGLLVQDRDLRRVRAEDLKCVTKRPPSTKEITELLFGWRIVKHVKSNAIVISRGFKVVGVGAGQMNRVRSVRLAVEQAGDLGIGSVMASDAFFPFPDGPQAAIEAGVTAIIQPGGSVKDQETIDLCNEHGVAMVFTGIRHFLH